MASSIALDGGHCYAIDCTCDGSAFRRRCEAHTSDMAGSRQRIGPAKSTRPVRVWIDGACSIHRQALNAGASLSVPSACLPAAVDTVGRRAFPTVQGLANHDYASPVQGRARTARMDARGLVHRGAREPGDCFELRERQAANVGPHDLRDQARAGTSWRRVLRRRRTRRKTQASARRDKRTTAVRQSGTRKLAAARFA